MIAKYTIFEGTIQERSFYTYDKNAFLIEESVDDGSERDPRNFHKMTQRIGTSMSPTTAVPYGLNKEVRKWYWNFESQSKQLLHRTVNHYTVIGLLVKQEHYDGSDTFVYELQWEHDLHGNITKEIDPFGNVTTKSYDSNDNLIWTHGPNPNFSKRCYYDYSNRLIKEEFHLADSHQVLTKQYHHNYTNLLTKESDFCGNETDYFYDDIGRLVITKYPEVAVDEESSKRYEKRLDYDVMDNLSVEYDCNDHLTIREYTARNRPHRIINPNKTQARILYTLRGIVKEKIDVDGKKTYYKCDWKDRPVSTELFADDGTLLMKEAKAYNAFHLLSETDNGGITSRYEYDSAGRTITAKRGDQRNSYQYNSYGLVETHAQHSSDGDAIVTCYSYDIIGRVVGERLEDGAGNVQAQVSYKYDCNGNRTHVMRETDEGVEETVTTFDCLNRPVCVIDSQGNQTTTRYSYDHVNELGQRVATVEVTDPQGRLALIIKDALSRDVETVCKDPFGEVIQRSRFFYDGNGNRISRIDDRIAGGKSVEQQKTVWSYNHQNQITQTIRGYKSSDHTVTRFEYDPYGRKVCQEDADGIQTRMEYDKKGRLSRYYSSDNTIDYRYTYGALDHILAVEDNISKRTTTLGYDDQFRLVYEELENGLSISYSPDLLGRDRAITLPDRTSIEIHYNGIQVKSIAKIGRDGQESYRHDYEAYNLSGALSKASLIGEGGTIDYKYDPLGRIRRIDHPCWQESINQYDRLGNILSKTTQDAGGVGDDSYSYNSLYQLVDEKGTWDHSYSYDSLDNRLREDSHSYTINSHNQVTACDDGSTYIYKRSGTLESSFIDGQSTTYKYDALHRLIAIVSQETEIHYLYDAFGRRHTKEISYKGERIVRHRYLYQHQSEIAVFDDQENLLEMRLLSPGPNADVGAAVAVEVGDCHYAPIHDHNGNITALIDAATGDVARSYRYSAFGAMKVFDGSGDELKTDEALISWGFSSKRLDPESGFHYFGNRYYNSRLGRWTTPDPAGEVDGPNLYAYVNNNPLTNIDPYGLFATPNSRTPETTNHSKERHLNTPTSGDRPSEGMEVKEERKKRSNRKESVTITDEDRAWCKKLALKCTMTGVVGHKRFQNLIIFIKTGIGTTPEECKRLAIEISEGLGGYEVRWICNPTKNFLSDVAGAAMTMLNGNSDAVQDTAKILKHDYKELCNRTDKPIVAGLAHSRGGLELKCALNFSSDQERAAMRITTMGTAGIIPSRGLQYSMNYYNNRDILRFCDPIGRILHCQDVRFTGYSSSGLGAPIRDHYIDSRGYLKVRNDYISSSIKLGEPLR